MSKDRIIRLLLRVYPQAWRSEYGEELSTILAGRSFTPSIIGDVFVSGIWQRLRYAELWQIGGAVLALWLIFGTVANSFSPFTRSAYDRFFQINGIIELAVGYTCVARYSKRLVVAAFASVKASLLGIIPELLLAALWAADLIHPTILKLDGAPNIYGHGITELCLRTEGVVSPAMLLIAVPITVLLAFFLGLVGAAIGIGISATRRLFDTTRW